MHHQTSNLPQLPAPPSVLLLVSMTLVQLGQLGMDEKEREEKVDFLSKVAGLGGGVGWILVLPWISEETARDLMGHVTRVLPGLY